MKEFDKYEMTDFIFKNLEEYWSNIADASANIFKELHLMEARNVGLEYKNESLILEESIKLFKDASSRATE